MERVFIQSVLFSTAILVVYAFVTPLHSSAEVILPFDEAAPVRKGVVAKVDAEAQSLVVDFSGVSVLVASTGSTTVTSPNGAEAKLSFLRDGTGVYVFGRYDKHSRIIEAEKIIMRNRPITERRGESRIEAQMTKKQGGGFMQGLEKLSLEPR